MKYVFTEHCLFGTCLSTGLARNFRNFFGDKMVPREGFEPTTN